MRPWSTLSGSLFLCLFVPAAMLACEKAENANESRWLTDYAAARKLARESGKPLFVVFRCQY